MHQVTNSEELVELVRSKPSLRVTGGGTKSALSRSANVSLSQLTGVLQYEPAEFTFTALAGTRLDEIQQLLLSKNQYLPFDPPLVAAGATLGGTVAAGLSGSGRFRYGGVRDFLLGVRLVTSQGEHVTTGSKVVKNAAGFDFPKLMVGSLGRFGVMTEMTFKVFPVPQCRVTLLLETEHLTQAVEMLCALATSPFEMECLDLDRSHSIWARIGGSQDSMEQRADKILQFAGGRGTLLTDYQDEEIWRSCQEFHWVTEGHHLVKVAITPDDIGVLTKAFGDLPYRICAGGHLAWLTWPHTRPHQELKDILCQIDRAALALTGEWTTPWLGTLRGMAFDQRLVAALDPEHKFSLSVHANK